MEAVKSSDVVKHQQPFQTFIQEQAAPGAGKHGQMCLRLHIFLGL